MRVLHGIRANPVVATCYPQQAAVVHPVQQLGAGPAVAAKPVSRPAVGKLGVHFARVHYATIAHELEHRFGLPPPCSIPLTPREWASVLGEVTASDDVRLDSYSLGGPLEELEARLRALIRRKHQTTTTELSLGDLRFDTVGRCATLNHQPLPLSAREMNVMELLLINSGHVISKAKLIDHLCGWQDDVTDNAIEVYISRLRRKLEPSPSVSLRTIRGIGYMLESTGVT